MYAPELNTNRFILWDVTIAPQMCKIQNVKNWLNTKATPSMHDRKRFSFTIQMNTPPVREDCGIDFGKEKLQF